MFRCHGTITCYKMSRHILSSSLSHHKLIAVPSPHLEQRLSERTPARVAYRRMGTRRIGALTFMPFEMYLMQVWESGDLSLGPIALPKLLYKLVSHLLSGIQ